MPGKSIGMNPAVHKKPHTLLLRWINSLVIDRYIKAKEAVVRVLGVILEDYILSGYYLGRRREDDPGNSFGVKALNLILLGKSESSRVAGLYKKYYRYIATSILLAIKGLAGAELVTSGRYYRDII